MTTFYSTWFECEPTWLNVHSPTLIISCPCDILFKLNCNSWKLRRLWERDKRAYMSQQNPLVYFKCVFFTQLSSVSAQFLRFLAFLHHRYVSCGERGLQSPVHRGTRKRGCLFLPAGASPGLQQQDMWGDGPLQPSPKMQPGVWAVQDYSEVLLLPGMDTRPRWTELSQHT